MIGVIFTGIGLAIFSFLVRYMTFRNAIHRGCDAYYFLLSSEEFRKHKKIPIVLPELFLLEQREQWYPPGFSIFLSLIPKGWLESFYWAISPLIDCVAVAFTYGFIYVVTGNIWLGLLGGVLHAVSSASVSDCTNLNSRLLGSLLYTGVILSFIGVTMGYIWLLPVGLVLGVTLLLTHKLSSQLLYVTLPLMAILTWNYTYVAGLVAITFIAVLGTCGFMVKIWRHQADILGFWRKHWTNLGAHQIHDSPMYGEPKSDSIFVGGKLFLGGLTGLLKQVQYMSMNPAALMIIFPIMNYGLLNDFDRAMLWWVAAIYVFAGGTVFIKQLRFIGEGHRYLKMAALPVGYLAVLPLFRGWQIPVVYWLALAVVFVVASFALWKMVQFMSDTTKTMVPFMSEDLLKVIEYLRNTEAENIMCVPDGIGDVVGYYSRKGILRGSHNYPFAMVEPFFPVHRLPIDYLLQAYGSSHLVVSKGYVDCERLEMPDAFQIVMDVENYVVYEKVT